MCGIAGFVGEGIQEDAKRMIGTLRHRGPDNEGVFFDNGVGLSHARLSILDLSVAGHQPMFNEKRTHAIVFNGEIYNFKELKKELSDLGCRFKSSSDTEVLLHLYEKFGEQCFERLNGMFAIGIYDFKEEKLILARDRMGKKPLYWSLVSGTLLFGSELKALRRHPLFKSEIDLVSLNKYFSYEYVPTPHTIYKNVYKLEPATFLAFQKGKIRKESFWKISFKPSNLSFNAALERLDELLTKSVSQRLVADVPVGIFLSGGLDSSAIAYYAQKNSPQTIQTYSIGFDENSFDESHYAEQVASFLGTNHHMQKLSSSDVLKFIPHIAEILDEPVADSSIVPTYLLSKFSKGGVTVALGGDGGDELFAGYPTFQADILAHWYEKLPKWTRHAFSKVIHGLPVSDRNLSIEFQFKKFIEGYEGERAHRHQRWLGSFSTAEKAELFLPEVWKELSEQNAFSDIDQYIQDHAVQDKRQEALLLYMRTYLMDQVLVKVDRASMKNALEIRAPFLDYRVVDFVNSLPYEYKLRGLTTKYILKKLMHGRLPRNIINRKKKGFNIPLSRWLKTELKTFCDQTLSPSAIKEGGLFQIETVERLKQEHFSGQKDHRKKLWTLLVFELWRKNA